MLLIVVHLLLLRRRSDHGLLSEALRWLAWGRADHRVAAGHHVYVRGWAAHEGTRLAVEVHRLVAARVELAWRGSHELLLAYWLSELRLLHERRLLGNKLTSWLSWQLCISGIRNSRIGTGRSETS